MTELCSGQATGDADADAADKSNPYMSTFSKATQKLDKCEHGHELELSQADKPNTKRHLESNSSDSDSQSDSDDNESVIGDKIPDISNKDIYLTKITKSKTTKLGLIKKSDRDYNSTSVCPFECSKRVQTNFSHIFSKMHENEPEVKTIKKLDSQQRKRAIEVLRLKGNHQHNLRVMRKKHGQIRVLRRKENSENENFFDIDEYGPCPCCLGWILKKNLRRHRTKCKSRDEILCNSITYLTVQSDILSGRITTKPCPMLLNEVFTIMKNDEVSKVAKNDDLIINLGNQWIKRNIGNRVMRRYYTSSVMRLASKLLIELQKLCGMKAPLTDFLKPAHFENVVIAALKCARQDDQDEEDIGAPSNSIKLGYDIKRLASAKFALGISCANQEMRRDGKEFLTLMGIRWHTEVTRLAREVLLEKSLNKTSCLPLPSDICTLANFMKTELTKFDVTDKSYKNFKNGATFALARLTLLNRRRCHEVQATRLESFEKRKIGVDAVSLEMMRELSEWEKKLLETQQLMQVRGKQAKPVPIIIPEDAIKVLQYLGDKHVRKEASIQKENRYLFASNGMGVVRAYDAIKKITDEAHLEMPNLIRTTKMRKYMATMVQCLDTTEAERQWIITHLGHTMDVHLTHYRQTSDILERVDVAKILLIQETNQVGKFVGRKPKEIDLEDILSRDVEVVGPDTCQEEDEAIPDIFEYYSEDKEPSARNKKSKPVMRQKWTNEEEAELRVLFLHNFQKLKCPNSKDIEKAIRMSMKRKGVIHKRKPDNIKKKVSNMLIKLRRKDSAIE